MLSKEQVADFHKQGYAIAPGVLSPEKVRALRASLEKIFAQPPASGDNWSVRNDVFAKNPELWWMLIEPGVVSSLRALLGEDFVYFPESAAHDSAFGGWHKDTTTGEQAGEDFHLQPDFLMVQTGFYLQDNGPYGGGLDVVPGSHLTPDMYVKPMAKGEWDKEQWKLRAEMAGRSMLRPLKRAMLGTPEKTSNATIPLKGSKTKPGEYTIPSKAGDLVMFHVRTDHKASWPEKTPIPADHRKLALFTVCSANNRHVETYKKFLLRRAEYPYLKNHRYPAELLKLAAAHSIRLG
jgi:hypothetical protein